MPNINLQAFLQGYTCPSTVSAKGLIDGQGLSLQKAGEETPLRLSREHKAIRAMSKDVPIEGLPTPGDYTTPGWFDNVGLGQVPTLARNALGAPVMMPYYSKMYTELAAPLIPSVTIPAQKGLIRRAAALAGRTAIGTGRFLAGAPFMAPFVNAPENLTDIVKAKWAKHNPEYAWESGHPMGSEESGIRKTPGKASWLLGFNPESTLPARQYARELYNHPRVNPNNPNTIRIQHYHNWALANDPAFANSAEGKEQIDKDYNAFFDLATQKYNPEEKTWEGMGKFQQHLKDNVSGYKQPSAEEVRQIQMMLRNKPKLNYDIADQSKGMQAYTKLQGVYDRNKHRPREFIKSVYKRLLDSRPKGALPGQRV
jgi:hypothetical protein